MSEIKLGCIVEDSVTGFVGTATARCVYMTGCIQYEVTPIRLKDGCPQKSWWLDEIRLSKATTESEEEAKKEPAPAPRGPGGGGPQDHPSENTPPSSIEEDQS